MYIKYESGFECLHSIDALNGLRVKIERKAAGYKRCIRFSSDDGNAEQEVQVRFKFKGEHNTYYYYLSLR